MRIISCLLASVMLFSALIASDVSSLQEHTRPLTPSQQMLELFLQPLDNEIFDNKDNIDLNYLRTLIAYHQGIIDAAQFLLAHSQHQKVRAIANGIIKTHKAEIVDFESLLPQLMEQKKLYSPKEVTLFNNYIKVSNEEIKEAINTLEFDKNINRNFLLTLIHHYQNALNSSREILQYSQIVEIRAIAKRIFTTYGQDIESFQNLLKTIR